MKAIGYFLALCAIWFLAAMGMVWQDLSLEPRHAGIYITLILVAGLIIGIPSVFYVICADVISTAFSFPRNILIYLLLILCGCAIFYALKYHWKDDRPPTTLEEWLPFFTSLFPQLAVAAAAPLWRLIKWANAKSIAATERRRDERDRYKPGH